MAWNIVDLITSSDRLYMLLKHFIKTIEARGCRLSKANKFSTLNHGFLSFVRLGILQFLCLIMVAIAVKIVAQDSVIVGDSFQ